MNYVCIHHDDGDGRGAAYEVAKYENNFNKNNFIETDYVKELPYDRISKDQKLYIVDFSFTEKTLPRLKKLMEITKNIIWIDHHKSSLDLIKAHPELDEIRGVRLEGISGMALTHMYLNDVYSLKECPMYIQYVSDFDCWKFELGKESEYFILGLQCQDYSPTSEIWKTLSSTGQETCDELIEKGKLIAKYNEQEFKDYLSKYSYESEIDGHKCLVVNRRAYSAIFGDKIKEYDIVSSWVYAEGVYTHSLYTDKKDIDCSKIAAKYGGGGHQGASGFTTKELMLKKK